MDSKIPEEFVFRLNTVLSQNLKSQIASSIWEVKRKLPFAFTEFRLEITKCDIKFVLEKFHFFSTKNNHAGVSLKNWRCQIAISNSAIQIAIKSVKSSNPEVVANCDNL
jgi:hypothetical protein